VANINWRVAFVIKIEELSFEFWLYVSEHD
jgi:hypothetical protein